MTRVLRAAVALAVASLGVLNTLGLGRVRPAAAVESVESGWWWRLADTGGTVPAPPFVDPGSLWIAADPTGPLAIGAMRFHLAEGEVAPIVTLDVDSATNPTQVSILACPVVGTWSPVHAGAWADRPSYDCTAGAIAGAFGLSDSKVQFDLSTVVSGRDVDMVLLTGTAPPVASVPDLPVPLPPLPVPTPTAPPPPAVVDLQVRQPTLQSVNVLQGPALEVGGAETPAVDAPFEFADDFVSDIVDLPPAGVPSAPVPAAGAPGTPPFVNVVPSTAARAALPLGEADDAARAIAGAVFALLALWWWRLSSSEPGGRPRLALGDDPSALPPPRAVREGRPPALR